MATGKAKNHHLVPRFLLNNFTDTKQLYLYDKLDDKISLKNTKKAHAFKNFNKIFNSVELEEKYAITESRTAPLINKINIEESLLFLTDEDKLLLMEFWLIQYMRTNLMRQFMASFLSTIIEKLKQMGAKDDFGEQIPKHFIDAHKENTLRFDNDLIKLETANNIGEILTFAQLYVSMKTFALIINPERDFYISDVAISIHNEVLPSSNYSNLGLCLQGCEMYLPVSYKLTLAFFDNDLPLVKSGKIDGKPQIASKNEVKFLNGLQVLWANRYIASRTSDFTLAKKLLKAFSGAKENSGYGVQIG